MIPQTNPKATYLAHKAAIDAAVARVLESGWYILGQEVTRFEQEFADAMQARWAIGVANGTDALELALRAIGIAHDDGVITVSHTAVATASAIARLGALPLFVDIEPSSYAMDPASLKAALASTAGRVAKAVVVVHLYGQPANMSALLELAKIHGLPVIEDCAQAHGATIAGRPVGTFGDLGCFSFYPTKNLGALGDGGAVIGTDPELAERIRMLREYGWRKRYISESVGFNSRLDEMQAAILRAKLPFLAGENKRRREIAARYGTLLAGAPLQLPQLIPDTEPVFHQYVVNTARRDELGASLREAGVATLVHYPAAVHQQQAFADPAMQPVPLPCTEAVIPCILSLPMYPELRSEQIDETGHAILRCLAS